MAGSRSGASGASDVSAEMARPETSVCHGDLRKQIRDDLKTSNTYKKHTNVVLTKWGVSTTQTRTNKSVTILVTRDKLTDEC